MSIFKLKTGYRVVADRFLLEGKSEKECIEIVKKMLMQNLRGNDYINLADGNVLSIASKNKEFRKLEHPGLPMNDFKYKMRQIAVTHLDELIEASQYAVFEEDYKGKHGNTVIGFEKRVVDLEVPKLNNSFQPLLFKLELTVLCRTSSRVLYDISKIKPIEKDAYSVLLRPAEARRFMEIDKASLHKRIVQLPGYVKTDFLETSKYVLDREPPGGDIWKSELAKRQKQRMLMTKNLKQHGFIPEKGILDRMELLSSLLHCNVGIKEISSWYKKGMFEGSEEICGYVKNLAEDLRRQEVHRSCILPEEPTR